MYLRSKPTLHVFLNAILAKETWQALRIAEFRVEVKIMGVTCKQIAVKAINNTAGPNSLVLTLLVFGAYPRMTMESPLSPLMREKDGWNGPYKIAAIDGHNVTVNMVNGLITFRSTSNPNAPQQQHALPIDTIVPLVKQLCKRGRPLGLRNKRKANLACNYSPGTYARITWDKS
ncbi:hypothetical protein BU23DRAFT_578609 [Bimuria novae-zelandiae CBS 107.79]|uniref:Uncharacterized protein n=1 Tax=Bimuria novae-zelandiae CBS 107.79 TaxID=1447943 RepID=A0A6A5VHR9_9PLEO|nr:hypothetical protein BU23DRAFT_578609 [Bimuria novae-zelandiae CBS 107.79]